jgi:restriction endonuclease S subunit
VQGSAQPNIAGSAFLALKVPVPPIEEQDQIIAIVDDLSKADRAANDRLKKSRAFMSAVLTRMLEAQDVQ